jgi:predicted alpha/beta superfamily hydrolase
MKQSKTVGLAFLVLISLSCTILFAQPQETDIILGKTVPFSSKVLGRDLELKIYLPEGYNNNSSAYPVLYDLNAFYCFTYDCGTIELLARNSEMPGMIVVGLPGLQNGYVPKPYEERVENPEGADLSLKFFKEELIPFVDKNYRTNKFRVLYGHSVGGLFTMYALFNYSDLFTAYITSSPWFQTMDQYWLKNINKMTKNRDLAHKFLFMTVGKEESELTINTYKELENWMSVQNFNGLTWKSSWVDGDHGSMVGKSIYDGFMFFFEGWKPPVSLIRNAEIEELKSFLKSSEEKWGYYGFERHSMLPEQRLNSLGYGLLGRQQNEKALKIFKFTVELYPNSFNAYDSLAEGYLVTGDKENAIKSYQLAVELNPGKSEYEKRVLHNSKDKLAELGVE